jgi:XTP/dITP diphosphohydrolase
MPDPESPPAQQPDALIPELLFATRNRGKAREVREMLAPLGVRVTTLDDHGETFSGHDPEESAPTFVGNALIKARAAAERVDLPALADDSGLEVDALGGAPGVHSARYAGVQGDDAANNRKLVAALEGVHPLARTARFRCALVLFLPDTAPPGPFDILRSARPGSVDLASGDGRPVRLEDGVAVAWNGVIEGRMIDEPRGEGGFGYDPYFLLPERGVTTAELAPEDKNALSHRGQAVRQMVRWLQALRTAL